MPDASSAPEVTPTTWTAVVTSDREYYDWMQFTSAHAGPPVPFPAYAAERRFRLVGNQMRIGRRSVARGLDPEIDLTGPPADPGISRLHAVLIATPDGSWAVLDPGSANGTLVNGNEIPTGNRCRCMTGTASTSAPGPRSPCTAGSRDGPHIAGHYPLWPGVNVHDHHDLRAAGDDPTWYAEVTYDQGDVRH